ncbi:S8 family serine peptidase [Glycomyces buryatensis]|uniref:S8 family peptidase n=1 Tax=Glycomyces buryatensis TaxID=2570927 RepID=A0A4S8QB62_9ACTN|nr:S8 family serine peptidase [Glycomyces buryatensis]THV40761.1 S8 family peptidase [Glycomyces buryatensis]
MSSPRSTLRRVGAASLAGAAAIASAGLGASAAWADPATGTVFGADSPDAVDGEYIVVMEDGSSTLASDSGAEVIDSFETIDGYLAEMTATEAAELAADDEVAFVEQNQTVSIADVQDNPPSWGLDRVDQLDLPLDDSYEYLGDGSGVTAYIVDTGILASHGQFAGRVGTGYDFVDDDSSPTDCQGHGTHVAGTIGATDYGLAKEVTLVGVRVLDCEGSGTNAGVIAGVDWVTENHSGPSVANMSLGGGYSAALNNAVDAAVASGVTFAVAAGNEDQNACNVSPASAASALTVAASDDSDTRAYFSNFGSCTDIFAPGVDITSTWIGSNSATNTISGTSMASPHVAGAVAVYLSLNPSATTDEVETWVSGNAATGRVSDVAGSPNRLLHTGSEGGGDPDPGEPSDCAQTSDASVALPDVSTTTATMTFECEGTARSASSLSVDITHTWRGDLVIDLIAPDGTAYPVKDSGFDSGDNVIATYPLDLSDEDSAGTWTLEITDVYFGDSGTLNSWTLEL